MVQSSPCSPVLAAIAPTTATLALAFMSSTPPEQPSTPLQSDVTSIPSDASFVPRLNPGQPFYTSDDIATAVRLSSRVVQHHIRNVFRDRGRMWNRLSFVEAQRVVDYIQKASYKRRQRETVRALNTTLGKKNLSSGA